MTRFSLCLIRFQKESLGLFGVCSNGPERASQLPGVDEILGQADVCRRPADGDLALGRAFRGICDFDLSPRHLSDLVDFGSLTPDDAAYELERQRAGEIENAFKWLHG